MGKLSCSFSFRIRCEDGGGKKECGAGSNTDGLSLGLLLALRPRNGPARRAGELGDDSLLLVLGQVLDQEFVGAFQLRVRPASGNLGFCVKWIEAIEAQP